MDSYFNLLDNASVFEILVRLDYPSLINILGIYPELKLRITASPYFDEIWKKYNITVTSYWANMAEYGDVRHEFEKDNKGFNHGSYKKFNSKGTLIDTTEFVQGQLHGKFQQYTSDGILVKYCVHEDGTKHGPSINYYSDGTLQKYSYYVKGAQNGLTMYYRRDGTIWKKYNYANDERNGVWLDYQDDGTSTLSEYKDNVHHGKELQWWSNGGRKSDGHYVNGKRHGYFTTYAQTGHIIKTRYYQNDTLIN